MRYDKRFFIFLFLVLATLFLLAWWFRLYPLSDMRQGEKVIIKDFKECQTAGYTVSGETPRSCAGPNGLIFYEETNDENQVCIQVITPAKNPATGETRDFPTPCDVPTGWEVISADETVCAQVITTAINPRTGEERDFPTPCDVPEGWTVNPANIE